MIPYFEQPQLKLGPLTFHAFGALVAAAVLVGTAVLRKRALKEKLDPELASRLVFWVLVGGFVGAHLVHSLVYFPDETLKNPISLFKIWEGISSFGGFLGAVTGAALFAGRAEFKKLDAPTRWRYIDAVGYAFVMGWIFGRAGCTVAYDHPGSPTDFFLGWEYKDHIVRHNLGFYEALYFLPVALVFFLVGQKRRAPGTFTALIAIMYPPVRFLFDYLRIVDVRYLGLTPGQWGSILVMIAGFVVLRHTRSLEQQEGELPRATAKKKGRG